MKTTIIPAAIILATCTFFGLAHGHGRAEGHQNRVGQGHPVGFYDAPVPALDGRDAGVNIPAVNYSTRVNIPEVTIIGIVPARPHLDDAAHIRQLMAKNMQCSEMTDNWVGGRSADCR